MKYYVSVTGLKVNSLWHVPTFWRNAIPSSMQAMSSPGNVYTATKRRNGVQHTLTVWEDRAAMLSFLRSGPHAQAMKITRKISDMSETKVYGYESDSIPTWEEALVKWEEHGTYHGKKPEPKKIVDGGESFLRKNYHPWAFLLLAFVVAFFARNTKAILLP